MTQDGTPEQEYAVGRGKPPKASQFQRGRSGNPRGRPKGSLNHSTILENAVNEKVSVIENGKRRMVSKLELMITQATNKAAKGDHRSTEFIIGQLERLAQRTQLAAASKTEADDPGSSEDEEMFDSFVTRLKGGTAA